MTGVQTCALPISRKYATDIVISKPPKVREDTAIKPAFYVADLEVVRAAAEKTGGFVKPRDQAWDIRGCVVLDGHDPEGNVVQFKQRVGA